MSSTKVSSVWSSDWAVAEGEPDVRGWRVIDDKKIGEVEDLLADVTRDEGALHPGRSRQRGGNQSR